MTDPRIIQEQINLFRRFKADLLERYPDLDEDTLFDTLEGETDLRELLVKLERSRENDEVLISGLKDRIADMNARLARYKYRSDGKRELLRQAMETSGLNKIEEPDFTISLRPSPPPVVIVDESALPESYLKTVTQIDRAGLRKALLSGVAVDGAMLGNSKLTVSIRTK